MRSLQFCWGHKLTPLAAYLWNYNLKNHLIINLYIPLKEEDRKTNQEQIMNKEIPFFISFSVFSNYVNFENFSISSSFMQKVNFSPQYYAKKARGVLKIIVFNLSGILSVVKTWLFYDKSCLISNALSSSSKLRMSKCIIIFVHKRIR